MGSCHLGIRAVPEGSIVKNHNVLVTAESTDKKCALDCGLGGNITVKSMVSNYVATFSYKAKQILKHFWKKQVTMWEAELKFKFHDFGYRGVS